jgi:hypothetical protein
MSAGSKCFLLRNPIRYRWICRELLKSPLAKTSPTGLKEKKWLVLIRPPLAGFESTADIMIGGKYVLPKNPTRVNRNHTIY